MEYLNEFAETKRVHAVGWYARIFQHEIDHLSGILYVDRMKVGSFTTVENLERMWKDVPVPEVEARLKLRGRS